MPFDKATTGARLLELAGRGVYVGTSSWKYAGWRGMLYDESRYLWRGRFAETRFERDCLSEYAEAFRTVCVDAAYYTFPTERYLANLAGQTPDGFLFGFKVTDAITVRKFPRLERFGERAGQPNPHFLDADLFGAAFLAPCESIRRKVGVLMFEFSRFYPADYAHGRDFVRELDAFLGRLPGGWPYAIELRNRHWLEPDYFKCLAAHGVAHVFNSWEAMPAVEEQLAMAGSITAPDLVVARFLLKPGRRYEEAVKAFQPYDQVREVNAPARAAGAALIAQGVSHPGRRTLIFVNNRLEGNALATIDAMTMP